MSETAATLDDLALDQLFRAARTQNKWQDRPVPDAKLHELYDLLKWGPTSANSSPARFVFIRTPEGKAKLKEALSAGNMEKTMTAPVTAIVCYDSYFYDKLGQLFPHADAKPWFTSSPEFAEKTAFRNGSLQGAYLMLAARAVGLDVGPTFASRKTLPVVTGLTTMPCCTAASTSARNSMPSCCSSSTARSKSSRRWSTPCCGSVCTS